LFAIKVIERSDDPLCVVDRHLDPEIEVLGVPGLAVDGDGEPADRQVAYLVVVQELQQIAEVLAEFHGGPSTTSDHLDRA
jgi:hypothetical protein